MRVRGRERQPYLIAMRGVGLREVKAVACRKPILEEYVSVGPEKGV